MGLGYLYFDRYCIDQDDPVVMSLMLQAMDQIYENAILTIVSIYGDDDRAGLSGVSRVFWVTQPWCDIRSGSVVLSCPTFSRLIPDSKWVTRG
ncbi:hypothetical protein BJ878DRAFT_328096 [Calycina marina]|uniref:Heterokaryon incompatibility domain-containing protein n=1 Tax=Calycina marina TaxID=1763456 RepID=A0A9P7Z5Z9_9HELO|nr:hypothetical protein BJ878DRAFT_328096 [Calycina marina]